MERVRVTPGMSPPTMRTTPNSPTVWVKARTVLVRNAARESGSDDAAEDGEWGGSEDAGGGDEFGVDAGEAGDQRLHGEGEAEEDGADDEAGEGEG